MEKKIPTYASTLWDELDGHQWEELLRWLPEFADKCDWSKLDDKDWKYLLCHRSEFKNRRCKSHPRAK